MTEEGTETKENAEGHTEDGKLAGQKPGVGDVNVVIGKGKKGPPPPIILPPPPPPPPPPLPAGPSTSDVLMMSQMSKIGEDLNALETKVKDVSNTQSSTIPA